METTFLFIFFTIISLGSMAGPAGAEMDMNLQDCAETEVKLIVNLLIIIIIMFNVYAEFVFMAN